MVWEGTLLLEPLPWVSILSNWATFYSTCFSPLSYCLYYIFGPPKARLKNMLVCCHAGLFFQVHPASWKKFLYHFEIEKIVIILIFNIFVIKFRNEHLKNFLTCRFLVDLVRWQQANIFLKSGPSYFLWYIFCPHKLYFILYVLSSYTSFYSTYFSIYATFSSVYFVVSGKYLPFLRIVSTEFPLR